MCLMYAKLGQWKPNANVSGMDLRHKPRNTAITYASGLAKSPTHGNKSTIGPSNGQTSFSLKVSSLGS